MPVTIDPRIAARRKAVAESRARVDLRRFLWVAVFGGFVGLVFWVMTSPWLSVQEIRIFGADRSDPAGILAAQHVVDGRPLVAIRPQRVVEALQADPWVAAASVDLVFPDAVEVTVEERRPVAWLTVGAGWALVADDGVVVDHAEVPGGDDPVIRISTEDPGLGEPLDDVTVTGIVTFLDALPAELARGAVARITDGEVWALITGRNVRLGRPIEMGEKAAAVAAVIDRSTEGVIDVIAPARPALWSTSPVEAAEPEDPDNPQPQVEGDG